MSNTLRVSAGQSESEVDAIFQRLQPGQLSGPVGQQAPALSRTATLLAARAGWTMRDWEKQDSAGLLALKRENPTAFRALFVAQYGVEPQGLSLAAPAPQTGALSSLTATKLAAHPTRTHRDWEKADPSFLLMLKREDPARYQQLFDAQYGHVSGRQ